MTARNILTALAYGALAIALTFVALRFAEGTPRELSYSELKQRIAAAEVAEVTIGATSIHGKLKAAPGGSASEFDVIRVEDPTLLADLQTHQVVVRGEQSSSSWATLLGWVLPMVLILGLIGLRPGVKRDRLSAMAVGSSNAKIYMEKDIKVTFADVAGVDEAKEELLELVDFLRAPERHNRLGGKLPKGVLLVGPPGTGKTLLARAVAGEASVPFFSISGSEFVEMFVGVGAARVRDLFNKAKEKAPCIIFIDELDALGKVRGMGPLSHDEREQTLNQLLVELDGFDTRAGVVLMAATNRPEILDPALLRAGRFDRHVLVDRPDKQGRLAILKVHARKVTLANTTDLEVIAALTPGLVGADLANLVNEAALLAARRQKSAIELADLQEAVERIIAGLEKRSRVLNDLEKQRVAHHEVGHALVGLSTPGLGAVQKISIIPRGIAALGYTVQVPTEERFLMTRGELENKIMGLLGGRAAEELVFGDLSTGAEDDLRKATAIAYSMVTVYGMSGELGNVSFAEAQSSFLLPAAPPTREHSQFIAHEIDIQVRRILDEQYERARVLLAARLPTLRSAALELLARETLSGDELRAIVESDRARAAQRFAS